MRVSWADTTLQHCLKSQDFYNIRYSDKCYDPGVRASNPRSRWILYLGKLGAVTLVMVTIVTQVTLVTGGDYGVADDIGNYRSLYYIAPLQYRQILSLAVNIFITKYRNIALTPIIITAILRSQQIHIYSNLSLLLTAH